MSLRPKSKSIDLNSVLRCILESDDGVVETLTRALGRFDVASARYVLELASGAFGPDDAATLEAASALAQRYFAAGDFFLAELLYRRLVDETGEEKRPRSPNHASYRYGLANSILCRGNFFLEAQSCYDLAMRFELYSTRSLRNADYNDAGALLRCLDIICGDPKKESDFGIFIYKNRQIIQTSSAISVHTFRKLAEEFLKSYFFETEEKRYLKALAKVARAKGKKHPEYAGQLNGLGTFYFSEGRLLEAESKLREAIDIDIATIGTLDLQYAIHCGNLARAIAAQGRHLEAEEHWKMAISICRKKLGDSHEVTKSLITGFLSVLEARNPSAPDISVFRALLT
jgi:tetratricopeptide (TPR) repeat protein